MNATAVSTIPVTMKREAGRESRKMETSSSTEPVAKSRSPMVTFRLARHEYEPNKGESSFSYTYAPRVGVDAIVESDSAELTDIFIEHVV